MYVYMLVCDSAIHYISSNAIKFLHISLNLFGLKGARVQGTSIKIHFINSINYANYMRVLTLVFIWLQIIPKYSRRRGT